VVRRIFDDYVAGGHSIRQITRRLNTDSVPSPTGKPTWGTSTLGRILRNEAYVGRVFFNRTEVVPDPQSKRKARQVPRAREEWIPIAVPALVDEHTFEAATRISRDNTQWSPRRAEPGYWLLRGLVKCGVCQVGANCHKMRGRNGTWHRYYYCRNHDPLRAGGEDRRCPERNIRADILDEFVFDEVRAALTRPETLLAGEQALAVRTPAPDDELLAAELARLDRKLDAAEAERRRLIDLYQAGLVDLTDMQRRAADVEARRRHLTERRDSLVTEREQLTRDNQLRRRVTDFARRAVAAFDHLDFEQKQTLLRLIIDEVQVTGWHVQIRLRIPLDDNPGEPQPPNPPHTDGDNSPELSIEDRLRSLGGPQRRLLPAQKPRPRPRPHRPSRHQLTPELVKIQLPKPDQISVAVDNDIAVAEIDLLASRDDLVIIGEAKTTPGLGTRKQRVSKAKKLATVARVLHADQILLCTSATDNWPEIDVKAVQDAVRSKFADAADQPRIRIITGLGTTGVNDLII
jgi:hypothetical protein